MELGEGVCECILRCSCRFTAIFCMNNGHDKATCLGKIVWQVHAGCIPFIIRSAIMSFVSKLGKYYAFSYVHIDDIYLFSY